MMRLTVIKDGVEIELKGLNANEVVMKESNTIFDPDAVIKAPYTMGLKCPAEGNDVALDLSRITYSTDEYYYYDARMYDGYTLLYKGKVMVERAVSVLHGGEYDLNFVASSYGILIQNKTLRDLLREPITLGATNSAIMVEMYDRINATYADSDFCFPTIALEEPYDEADALPNIPEGGNVFDQADPAYYYDDTEGTRWPAMPQIFLLKVLKACFEEYGYRMVGSILQDAYMQRQFVFGMHSLDCIGPKNSGSMRTTVDQSIGTSWVAATWQEVVRNNHGNLFPVSSTVIAEAINSGNHRMNVVVRVSEISGASTLEIRMIGGSTALASVTPVVGDNLLAFNVTMAAADDVGFELRTDAGTLTMAAGSVGGYLEVATAGVKWNKWVRYWSLGDCLPAKSIADFLKAVKKEYGILFDIDENAGTVEMLWIDDLLASNVTDAVGESSEQEEIEFMERNRLRLAYGNEHIEDEGQYRAPNVSQIAADDYDVENYTQNDNSYRKGITLKGIAAKSPAVGTQGEDKEISTGSELVEMKGLTIDVDDLGGAYIFFCPKVKLKLDSDWNDGDNTGWPLMFGTYCGMRSFASGTDDYPFATPYNRDPDGAVMSGILSHAPLDEVGTLYNSKLKRWHKWLSGEVRVTINEFVPLSETSGHRLNVRRGKYYKGKAWKVMEQTRKVGGGDGPIEIVMSSRDYDAVLIDIKNQN